MGLGYVGSGQSVHLGGQWFRRSPVDLFHFNAIARLWADWERAETCRWRPQEGMDAVASGSHPLLTRRGIFRNQL